MAAVQMVPGNGTVASNLERATPFVEEAARDRAQLILLPELIAAGYTWTRALWNAGEAKVGPTAEWLARTSRRLGVYLGTSFLEADGDDFYNTFVLTTPEGTEAGRVRKETPALLEACFFRGDSGSHLIECGLGRIGVGICFENQLAFLPRQMQARSIDLMLMPHSAPSLLDAFPFFREIFPDSMNRLKDVAQRFASILGVPVVMANTCGPWQGGGNIARAAEFAGFSAIVDSDQTIKLQLQTQQQVIVADVLLDPARKTSTPAPRHGRWIEPTPFPLRAAFWLPERLGACSYWLSAERRAKAREISCATG